MKLLPPGPSRRVVIAGVALGLTAALMSWIGGDEFCDVAADDGLSADGIKVGEQHAKKREDFDDRLDDASASAPQAVAEDVETIEAAMDDARDPSKVSSQKVARAYSHIDEWTAANC